MKQFNIGIFLLLLALLPIPAQAQVKWNQRWQNYIDQYKDIAIVEMQRYGIPASITLAQGLLESAAGTSDLARKANNHFGIKSHGWSGRTVRHDDDYRGEKFRAYDSVLDSYEDHSKFLAHRPRYKDLFSLDRTDYKGWAHGLKRAGYATNPAYARRLIDIIEAYRLHEYDLVSPKKEERRCDLAITTNKIVKPVAQSVVVHRLLCFNDGFYVVARQGDTFRSIAKEMDVDAHDLAKYNERNKNAKLQAGDIVWLSKKQKRAPKKQFKDHPYHTVLTSMSFYDIAQMYGIRLKSLMKMNPQLATRDYKLRIGDAVRIY